MPFIGLSILVQVLCAVHCIRNGRNQMWLMAIIFLSLPGCFAYFLLEILPGMRGRREVRAAAAVAAKKIDPDRDLRAAREALDMTDSAATRAALGDALADAGQWREAAVRYAEAIAKTPGDGDRGLKVKLARATLEAGDPAAARDLLRALPPAASASENDRVALLLARSLDEAGDAEGALALYADVGERLPGAEAQCRHAALLIRLGRSAEAVPLLEEAERRARRVDRFERHRDRDMYDWAARTRSELGGRG
jgi:hypothetical protein